MFVWILFVLKQIYPYHMQFALECAKIDSCAIARFQFLFVTICRNDSISIASLWICYSLLFHYILSLLSFIFAVPDYSALTILHFTVAKSMEHTKS